MQTKYCYKCGKEINEDAEFCPNCGAKQNHTNDEPRQSHVDANDDQSESQSNSTTSKGVSMGQAFTLFWRNYFNFGGRSSRSEFWFWYLWQLIIGLIFVFLIGMIGGQQASPAMDNIIGFIIIVGIIYSVGSAIPTISLDARRMRDAGLPTVAITLILIACLIPFVDIIPALFMLVVFFLPTKEMSH